MKNKKMMIYSFIIFIGIILLICSLPNRSNAISLEDAMKENVYIMSTYKDANGTLIRGKLEHYDTGNQRITNAKKNV